MKVENEIEEWRIFPLCADYKVSNTGRIIRIPKIYIHRSGREDLLPERELCQLTTPRRYKRVQLSIDGVKDKWLVHRIVGITFIPNPENKPQINHKNGVRHDNRVSNLEWATNQENNLHAFRELGRKPSCPQTGKSGSMHHAAKRVYCPTLSIYFGSAREAARELGIVQGRISHVCTGKQNHTSGLVFKYV